MKRKGSRKGGKLGDSYSGRWAWAEWQYAVYTSTRVLAQDSYKCGVLFTAKHGT